MSAQIDWSEPGEDRCWSCGHLFDMLCECSCCFDCHDEVPDG